MSCKAWERFESLSRSHSQASSRAGRPKVFRNGWSICPSGIEMAFEFAGMLLKAVGTSATLEMASSRTSAGRSFVTACEK